MSKLRWLSNAILKLITFKLFVIKVCVMRPFKGLTVCRIYILVLSFQLKGMVGPHFELQNPFSVILKIRCPMLELCQGKHSEILKYSLLNIPYTYIPT